MLWDNTTDIEQNCVWFVTFTATLLWQRTGEYLTMLLHITLKICHLYYPHKDSRQKLNVFSPSSSVYDAFSALVFASLTDPSTLAGVNCKSLQKWYFSNWNQINRSPWTNISSIFMSFDFGPILVLNVHSPSHYVLRNRHPSLADNPSRLLHNI